MKKEISKRLLPWYEVNKRNLPWRNNRDAYRIWVSEIMLQQTRVEAVKPYYERFMNAFPSLVALAHAQEDELHKLWEGLGYYSRVRNMKKAAMICVEQFAGALPSTYEQLLSLPGIGPYTAGAIASIAFNKQVCAIDGNVLRVFARLYAIEEDILKDSTKKLVQSLIEKDLSNDMGLFNQALMDLGSSICVANTNARCNICPLQEDCEAYRKGLTNRLPIRNKKTKRKQLKYTVVIYVCQDKVLIHKRKNTGLLASLYEFLVLEGHYAKKDFPNSEYLGKYKHLFSHIEWNMKGFIIESDECFTKENFQWVKIMDIENIYSIPSAFKYYKEKLLNDYR